jgi:hypothetical protein
VEVVEVLLEEQVVDLEVELVVIENHQVVLLVVTLDLL